MATSTQRTDIMSLEPLPEKELKIPAGFSLYPSQLDKLDAIANYIGGNRSETVGQLIDSAFVQLKEKDNA